MAATLHTAAGSFSNREIATALWLLALLVWALRQTTVRGSLFSLAGSFGDPRLIAGIGAMALYCAACVCLLAACGVWRVWLLKDTVVWFCVSATSMAYRCVMQEEREGVFRKLWAENFAVVVLLQFLVNGYTFSLLGELFLMPAIAVLVLFNARAVSLHDGAVVARVTSRPIGLLGIAILGLAVIRAACDLRNLGTWDTARSVALTPFLFIMFLPFLYGLALACAYERIFIRISRGVKKDQSVKRYARRRILMRVHVSIRRAEQLLRKHADNLMHAQTEADVDRIVGRGTES